MSDFKTYLKNRLLNRSIEAHKRILAEGESVDLAAIGYEEGTPYNRVYTYNAYMVLQKLGFKGDEATNPESKSTKYLDELAAKELPNEEIIQLLIEYRNQSVNS